MELLLSSYLSLLLVQIWFHTIEVVYLLPTKVGISTKNIILIAVLKEQDLNPIFSVNDINFPKLYNFFLL